ncbi:MULTISPECIES: P-loop ATPase, Sll1717 family [Eubacteriales]|uniref:Uncharacterized protein n=1 Tax=Bittarella massiliensis (ex Durand et al. 2017) TaxID=1720313 RepID=A0AAQ1MFS3_9FIRM|nr:MULTISPECIES: hypothetical protein [Eubacteriales]ERJ00204.1 hypothetical protein HMPREF0262_01069 [Clostridium sp. ATCC 29733]SHG57141.1 hypothetical protein SAMN05444424_2731 [Bittarella massiliensis (ex Durand et al. 2017)]
MKKETLLKELNFGSVDSESETNLDKIFIQTKNFDEFLDPNTALLLGSKGAGKSALYRLFTKYEESAREMAQHAIDNVYLVAGVGFKDVAEMDDMQLLNQIESQNISPEAAWKIYITYKIIHSLYKSYSIVCGKNGRRVLQKSHSIKDYRISAILKRLYECFIGEPPQLEQIDFKDVSILLSKNSKVSIYELLSEINDYLVSEKKTVWLLLDKIDELFPNKANVRKECIEGLFLAYIDFVSRYSNIKLKIFLRTDIWNTLSFVNKSHLTDKTTIITWHEDSLKHLLVKRAVYNKTIRKYVEESAHTDSWEKDVNGCFNALFPPKVYPGPREAKTMSWIIERSKDGLGGVYPREIINFGNYSKQEELKLKEELDREINPNTSLISGLSIRNAFSYVSTVKVQSYLSEFRYLSKHFERFTGQQTAEYSQEEIIKLMENLQPEGEDMIRQLHETGVISYSSGQILTRDAKIVVPRLFRSGLGIVTFGRP